MCSFLLRDVAADIAMDLEGNTRVKYFAPVGSRKYFAEGY